MTIEKEYFLATTALQEYWDKSKHLIFLSQACVPYNFTAKETILPDPWETANALHRARDYIETVHKRLLVSLTQSLNQIHQVNYSQRYWEILLGPWLRIYLAVFYDRYISLRAAYATYSHIQTISLTKNSYAYAQTPQEFSGYLLTDIFNLQIYSFILDYLNAESKQKYVNVSDKLATKEQVPEHFIKRFIRQTTNSIFKVFGKKNKIVFVDSGVSVQTLLKLFIKSQGKIVPLTLANDVINADVNWDMRLSLLKITLTNADFENCVINALPYFMPICFLETYQQYAQQSDLLALQPELIFSAMGWHYNEPFKFMAARAHEKGSLLAGHQHGGDYGILDYHASEIHELNVTNRFYTWGWNDNHATNQIKPFYALKLRETKIRSRKPAETYYLYGTSNGRRYLLRFNYSITAILDYFNFQQRFFNALPTEIRDKLQVRLYPSDWGWERVKRFKDANLDLHFQPAHISFAQGLRDAKLYISDHISTTFAESIATNKPTLIVADPNMWSVRAAAKPYFDELKEVGIVFEDPQQAANALQKIDVNVDDWWNEKHRQTVINTFKGRFCRSASMNLNEWINELLAPRV